ncbi:beta/alpha barrel domain-containing protein [Arthrobacter sp. MDB2-24]
MINAELVEEAQRAGITLAGSLIAVPGHQRPSLAAHLLEAGHWIHADVISGSYLGQSGVSHDEIMDLYLAVGPQLDVHLMVDDLVEAIEELPSRLGRITIQYSEASNIESAVQVARLKARKVWIAVNEPSPVDLARTRACDPDGLLLMLTPPGVPGHAADLDRLDVLTDRSSAALPWGVDGGVNEQNLRTLGDGGITYAVAGRALVQPHGVRQPSDHQQRVETHG